MNLHYTLPPKFGYSKLKEPPLIYSISNRLTATVVISKLDINICLESKRPKRRTLSLDYPLLEAMVNSFKVKTEDLVSHNSIKIKRGETGAKVSFVKGKTRWIFSNEEFDNILAIYKDYTAHQIYLNESLASPFVYGLESDFKTTKLDLVQRIIALLSFYRLWHERRFIETDPPIQVHGIKDCLFFGDKNDAKKFFKKFVENYCKNNNMLNASIAKVTFKEVLTIANSLRDVYHLEFLMDRSEAADLLINANIDEVKFNLQKYAWDYYTQNTDLDIDVLSLCLLHLIGPWGEHRLVCDKCFECDGWHSYCENFYNCIHHQGKLGVNYYLLFYDEQKLPKPSVLKRNTGIIRFHRY